MTSVIVSWSDKNDQRLWEMINLSGAQSLIAKAMGLVAGNVTGGGGKATTTKT